MAAMLGNLRQGCWYGRISLHAICKHANSIACDRHWIAFRGLGDFQSWKRMRGRWEICLVKQCLPLRNIRFISFNKNVKNAERDRTCYKPSLSESDPYTFLRSGCTLLLTGQKKKICLSVLKVISRICMIPELCCQELPGSCNSQTIFLEQLHRGEDCFHL